MRNTTKIQLRLTDEENKIVVFYKTAHNLDTKEEAIKQIIKNTKKSLKEEMNKIL